jgi:hypothetical protein
MVLKFTESTYSTYSAYVDHPCLGELGNSRQTWVHGPPASSEPQSQMNKKTLILPRNKNYTEIDESPAQFRLYAYMKITKRKTE